MVHPAPPTHSAAVIPFPGSPDRKGRLTWLDRASVLAREDAARARGYERLLVHTPPPNAEPDTPDAVMLYPAGERWARWGLARQPGGVLVWRCSDGAELGRFATMAEALDAALAAPDPAPRRSRSRGTA